MMSERIVYTGGTFDLPHPGHVNLLKQCRAVAGQDGKVVVGLNTDEFVEQYKGKAPVMNYFERATMLEAMRDVDEVVPNEGGADSKPVLARVRPSFLVVGSDWAAKDYYKQMGFTPGWLEHHRITLLYVPYTQGISTTELKRRMA